MTDSDVFAIYENGSLKPVETTWGGWAPLAAVSVWEGLTDTQRTLLVDVVKSQLSKMAEEDGFTTGDWTYEVVSEGFSPEWRDAHGKVHPGIPMTVLRGGLRNNGADGEGTDLPIDPGV